jgi:branched-chain amino acid transport system permease protein
MEFTQALISGILLGGVFAAMSAGFSLTWGVTKAINLSHSLFGLISAYIAYWLLKLIGMDPIISLAVSIPLAFLYGIAVYRSIVTQTEKRSKDLTAASLILFFGVIIVLENILLLAFKSDTRFITTFYSGQSLFVGGVALPVTSLIAFALAVATIAALYFFLHRIYMGKAVRAVWQDKEGAMLSGIDIRRVTTITWGVALASSAVAGVSMGFMQALQPSVFFTWLVFAFLIAVLGGVGSIIGSAVAGLTVGVVIGVSGHFLPYQWVNLILFILLFIVLLVRPQGLFQR